MRPALDVSYPRFLPVGDGALSVEFGDAISPALNDRVIALDIALAAAELPGIVETIPSIAQPEGIAVPVMG